MILEIERDEKSINQTALHALWGMGSQAQEVVPLLVRLLGHNDPKVQTYAVETLGRVGPDSAPAVLALVAILEREPADSPPPAILEIGDDRLLRKHVVIALGEIGSASRSAAPALLRIIDHRRPPPDRPQGSRTFWPDAEIDAVHVLGRIGNNSREILSRLSQLLTIDEPAYNPRAVPCLRVEALQSLILLTEDRAAMFPDLMKFLDDDSWMVRVHAALAMGQCCGDRREGIERLDTGLTDKNAYVRTAAALVLRDIGPATESAVPTLQSVIRHVPNSAPNGLRVPWEPYDDRLIAPGGEDLRRLSVAEAARQALSAITPATAQPPGDRESPPRDGIDPR